MIWPNLVKVWDNFRKKTFPPSSNDFDVRLRNLENLSISISDELGRINNNISRPYYYLGDNWGLTWLSSGEPFFVNTNDKGITPWIVLGGQWETFVDNIMQKILREGDICFDIGANMGYYTIKMLAKIGAEGHVYAFEPNNQLYPFLSENISINAARGRADAFPFVVGKEKGRGGIEFEYSNMGGGRIIETQNGGVEIVAIDEISDFTNKVDFIKIDVEGYEPAVFEGMSKLHAKNPDSIVISEYSHQSWSVHGDPMSILKTFAGDRDIFWINYDGTFVALNDHDDRCKTDRVSYVLMAKKTDERFARIAHLERPFSLNQNS